MAARIEVQPSEPVSTVPVPPTPIIRDHPPYLLLADDDRAEAVALAELLRKEAIACDVVHSEGDALCAFMARDYDLVLMNLRGPIQASLDAAKAIRRLERSLPEPKAPIFILADGATEKERAFAKDAGVDDILERRKDINDLAAIVEREFEVERRTPPGQIPREPLQFAKLLAATGGDEVAALARADEFARLLGGAIISVRAAIAAGDVAVNLRVAEAMRLESINYGSERVRRIGTLLTRMTTPGQLADRGAELLREFEDAARDLDSWCKLGLGRVVFEVKAAVAAAPASPPVASVKRTVVKVYSFLKNREDIFSKAS